MTIGATDFGVGLDVDRTAGGTFSQFACVRVSSTAGAIIATTTATQIAIGFAQEAATASGDLIRTRLSGTSLCIAQTTIAANADLLGPTTTSGKIATQSSTHYCAQPLFEEAAAADNLVPIFINIGENA
ncbi:MAG: hypothetical protein KC729_00070 [Candidatus Eisenbacteria bacterium]|uniref:DUF2190 family protein n=1 Tax=Eiseniibacteriota bacterium TaxID=2212470 RepID=A0A956LUP3_UNCEI|nr:hypothetical protein [Candidatus Eisenbacteria bacterium]